MSSPKEPTNAHSIADAIHATTEPISLAENEGEQSTGASTTGADRKSVV